jgi:Zn-dependent peptidase ImmA (M78 family)/transcriptional regulator with XRE-family HTH domain
MSSNIFFEPDRLRQARQLALLTKREVAEASGVSPAAVGQYEAGIAVPRADTLKKLATTLDVPVEFFAPGRPLQRLETSETYFESLRATTVKQRHSATSFAEQIWELSHALETHVRFPQIQLNTIPHGDTDIQHTPEEAARVMRDLWGLGSEPIGHLVSQLEAHGIVCCLAPPTPHGVPRINAYSTLAFRRPLVVLTADRADDVLRHRFSAAHELGHLVLHGGSPSGEPWLERQADAFAAEFLTPRSVLRQELPSRLDFAKLYRLSERWGVQVRMLIYRSQELGLISESTARRAYIRMSQSPQEQRPIQQYEGEVPSMLNAAFELASQRGVSARALADQLKWKPRRVRQLLGEAEDPRPELRIVT